MLPGRRKGTTARRLRKGDVRLALSVAAAGALLLVSVLAMFEGSSVRKGIQWVAGQFSEDEQRVIWNDLSDESRQIIRKHMEPEPR